MFNTNSPWSPSGYGQEMDELAPLIRDEGYPLALICFYGLEGNKVMLEGRHHDIPMYPKIASVWGDDAMVNHQKDFNADVIFTFQDIWTLDTRALDNLKCWVALVPIDHNPVPPAIFERLKHAYRVVTYSKFGHDELQRQGMHSTYIQHTVDTNIYKPLQDKSEIRKKIGIPEDIFLFGMVSANKDNPPRKSFQEVMDAFKLFHDKHPKSGLYLHTMFEQSGGFPIAEYAKVLKIQDFIYHVQPYEYLFKIDKEGMANIYNTFDCLLCPSTNEGFGLPIIEAQACSIPVITNDFTSTPELIIEGETGFKCDVLYHRFTPLLSFIGIPDVKSIYNCMEKMFNADRVKMGVKAREYTVENYDTKKIFKEKWVPFLSKLSLEICPTVDTKEMK